MMFSAIQLHLQWTEAEHAKERRELKNWDPEIGDDPKPWINFNSHLNRSFYLREFYLLICVETAIDRTPSQVTDTIFKKKKK